MKFKNFDKIEMHKFIELDKNSPRVLFVKGEQKLFLKRTKEALDVKWTEFEEFIKMIGYSPGSLRNWRAEVCGMPLSVITLISRTSNMDIPKNIQIKEKN